MSEIAIDLPESVPALPADDTTYVVPGPLGLWFTQGAPHAGLVLGLSPVAVVVNIFLMVLVVETANSFSLVGIFLLGFFGIAVVVLLSVASLLARSARRRHVRDATTQYAPRLQSSKDWFVRGDITEGEYEQLRGLIEPATTDKAPDIMAQTTASTLRIFLVLLTIASALFAPINVVAVVELLYEGDLIVVLSLLLIDVALVYLVITAWRAARAAGTTAKALKASIAKRIDALEDDILRTARSRRGPSGTTGGHQPYGAGPSFRAYGGR